MIRRATIDDIPALIALSGASPTAAHWTEQQYRSAFVDSHPQRLILLAEYDGIAGFLVASAVAGEWELENIVVNPDLRGKGIGSALLQALFDEAERAHATKLFLEVRESNSAARGVYERTGFRVSGRRPGYYHNPMEDAILYEKNLENSAPEIG